MEERDFLLKHARHPSHSGDVGAFAHQGSCKNPLCGDAVSVGVELDGDRISHIRIQANGCGISVASASLMAERTEGLSVEDAMKDLAAFNEALTSAGPWPERIESLKMLSRLRESPTRVPCALIGWYALKDALSN